MALARSRRLRWLWLFPLLCVAAYLLRGRVAAGNRLVAGSRRRSCQSRCGPGAGWRQLRQPHPLRRRSACGRDMFRWFWSVVQAVSTTSTNPNSRSSSRWSTATLAEWFAPLHHDATSTVEEARVPAARTAATAECARFLLVTSDYHTARAVRIFRDEAQTDGSATANARGRRPGPVFRRRTAGGSTAKRARRSSSRSRRPSRRRWGM